MEHQWEVRTSTSVYRKAGNAVNTDLVIWWVQTGKKKIFWWPVWKNCEKEDVFVLNILVKLRCFQNVLLNFIFTSTEEVISPTVSSLMWFYLFIFILGHCPVYSGNAAAPPPALGDNRRHQGHSTTGRESTRLVLNLYCPECKGSVSYRLWSVTP